MADEGTSDGTGNAPESTGQAPATQPSFSVPEGQRLVSESEYETLQRNSVALSGSQPLIDAAVAAGFKTPESFQNISKLGDRVDLDDLSRLLAPKEPEIEQTAQGMTEEQFKTMLDERDVRRDALNVHRTSQSAEGAGLDTLAKELAGENADEFAIAEWRERLDGRVSQNMLYYPEDNPLATERNRPYGESDFQALRDHYKEIAEKRAAASTADTAKAASEAAKKPAPTPAGNVGGEGKTHDEEPQDAESFKSDRRQKAVELVDARRKAGSPVST